MKEINLLIGEFTISEEEIREALDYVLNGCKCFSIQKKNFFIFSKSKDEINEKFLAFFDQDKNFDETKNKIFELMKWDNFVIIGSGLIELSVINRNPEVPQFILNFGENKQGEKITPNCLPFFQVFRNEILKITTKLPHNDFVVKAIFSSLEKEKTIVVEKN